MNKDIPRTPEGLQLTGITIKGVKVSIESEKILRKYLAEKIHLTQPFKLAPITMGEIMKIVFLPSWKRRYQKLDLVYPDSWFSCQCLFRFNHNFEGERKIYTHRLFLDLIADSFKAHRPIIFVGIDKYQKNNLKRKLKSLFPQSGDICFLHPEMTQYQPEETLIWLNRTHYGFVISPINQKLRDHLIYNLHQGLLLFDNGQLNRYQKDRKKGWKRKNQWFFPRNLGKFFFNLGKLLFTIFKFLYGWIIFYYPLKIVFSISFWIFSFIINKIKKRPIIIN